MVLAANKADPGGAGAPVMADQLTFTTMVDLYRDAQSGICSGPEKIPGHG
jgi:hypothetical protein